MVVAAAAAVVGVVVVVLGGGGVSVPIGDNSAAVGGRVPLQQELDRE